MAWEQLKQAVDDAITSNGNNEITGEILRNILTNNIIDRLGALQYKGLAVPTTNPGFPEANVFYIAKTPGTYANFGSKVINAGQVGIIRKTGTGSIQTWTLDIIFNASGEGGDQNNKVRVISYGLITDDGTPGFNMADHVVQRLNGNPYTIAADETPVVIEGHRMKVIDGVNTSLGKYIYLLKSGKGNYGFGATPFTIQNLYWLTVTSSTVASIQVGAGNEIISLGDIPSGNFLPVANTGNYDFTLSGSTTEEGDVITYYFSYTTDDVLYFVQFIGEAGIYGAGNNFTMDMFISTANSDDPTGPPAQTSQLTPWVLIIPSVSGNALQSSKLVNAASIGYIVSQEGGIVTGGFTFDPVTGIISNYPVAAGEKHIVHYSKS